MSIYDIPALLYYFPTDDISLYRGNPEDAPHAATKGLCYDADIVNYPGCPDSSAISMRNMFTALNEIIRATDSHGVIPAREGLLRNLVIRNQRNFMQHEFFRKANGRTAQEMSPLSAVIEVPTRYLLNYLSQFETDGYQIGELLRSREMTCLYQVNAGFRGDPYPGCLAAIDYLVCRQGKTFEDRRNNLVMVWGKVIVDHINQTIEIVDERGSTISDFFHAVQGSERLNLLTKFYNQLQNKEKPRYLMQVRYGSTYSKVKHIRVYSYFADAILFPDGALWRDA